jgi:ferredoxin
MAVTTFSPSTNTSRIPQHCTGCGDCVPACLWQALELEAPALEIFAPCYSLNRPNPSGPATNSNAVGAPQVNLVTHTPNIPAPAQQTLKGSLSPAVAPFAAAFPPRAACRRGP